MTTFPSLHPNTRSLTFGNTPQGEFVSGDGVPVRFLFGSKRVQQQLALSFESITESELQTILSHYESQQGSLIPFDLPATVWAGYSTVPVSSVDYEWRYTSAPQVTPTAPSRFTITLELGSAIA